MNCTRQWGEQTHVARDTAFFRCSRDLRGLIRSPGGRKPFLCSQSLCWCDRHSRDGQTKQPGDPNYTPCLLLPPILEARFGPCFEAVAWKGPARTDWPDGSGHLLIADLHKRWCKNRASVPSELHMQENSLEDGIIITIATEHLLCAGGQD